MNDYDVTAWASGILITPQHFERQEQAMKAQVQASLRRLGNHMWGVDRLEIDEAMLPLGIIKIKHLAGRFEDGTEFYYDAQDRYSIELPLKETMANEMIYLAVANNQLVSEANDANKRYTIDEIIALNTIDAEAPAKPILTRRLHLQLLREKDKKEHCLYFPLLKVSKADPENGIVLNQDYVPPSLDVIQNSQLMSVLSRSLLLIDRKQKQLADLLGTPLQSRNISSLTDISLLQTLNKYLTILSELAERPCLHPYTLYRSYQLLLAELGTYYQEKRTAIKLPVYDHLALQKCFAIAGKHFTEILQLKFEHQANQLQLRKDDQKLYHAVFENSQAINSSEIILGLRVADKEQREQLASLVKVASDRQINDIINLQLSGIPYKPLDLVPPQLPYYEDMLYLRLQKRGEHWVALSKEKQCAIYLGGLDKGVQVMLWAIPELNLGGADE